MLLFVYGTLKRGRANHLLIEDCEYVCDAFTDKSFTLITGGLPFLVKRPGAGAKGEVYSIDKDTLRAVDRLEGHPGFYKRETITVTNFETGEQLEACAYIHPDIFHEGYRWKYDIVKEY